MHVSVDIDGVLLDIMVTYCEIFNKLYNTNYEKQDVKNWEFFRDWNITEKEAFEIFYKVYENSTLIPFIDEDAPPILRELNLKHKIYIVTARQAKFKIPTLEKLRIHGIKKNIHYEELLFLEPRPYDVKLQHKFDIYIDDSPNLATSIMKLKDRILLLYDQPWNQTIECNGNVFRVYNWKDIYHFFSDVGD
ncbi:MAG: hypothetical protein ACFE8V_11645 [Promethearchaeota archaeon]